MPLPVAYFQPETFAQANPMLAGMAATQDIYSQTLQNQQLQQTIKNQILQNQIAGVQAQYAQPNAQQDLLHNQLSNQIMQPQAQYAPQMTQADLALKRAMPNYYNAMAGESGARAGMYGAQTNLLRQQTPYLVDQAQASVFNDPMLSRANQLAMAQQSSGANPYLAQNLSQLGFGAQPGGASASQGGGGSYPSQIPLTNGAGPINPLASPRMMSGDPQQNYLMFGSPLSPYMQMQLQAMGKGMDTQQTAQATDYSKALTDASTSANLGNQIDQFTNQFQKGYANTDLTGWAEGHLPAATSAAQQADNASQNIAALVAKTIAGGRVTNYEMQYINNLKPNRAMNPQTAQMAGDFLKQKSIRMQEEQQFLNTAKNSGVDIYTANQLWNQYNNQRPVYDFGSQSPNTQFQNSWKDFLTPQAVASAQMGQSYVPMPKFASQTEAKNWFKSLSPSDRMTVAAEGGQK